MATSDSVMNGFTLTCDRSTCRVTRMAHPHPQCQLAMKNTS